MEKVRPIDQALKMQIDKLLKAATAPPPTGEHLLPDGGQTHKQAPHNPFALVVHVAEEISPVDNLVAATENPLLLKPRPDKLIPKTHVVTTQDGELVEVPGRRSGSIARFIALTFCATNRK